MGGRWREAEVLAVEENYPERGLVWDGWDDLLPGRSRNAIGKKARKLGLAVNTRWTPEEVQALVEHYSFNPRTWPGWATVLPDKTAGQIEDKARKLGLRSYRGRGPHSLSQRDRAALVRWIKAFSSSTGAPFEDCVWELAKMSRRPNAGK